MVFGFSTKNICDIHNNYTRCKIVLQIPQLCKSHILNNIGFVRYLLFIDGETWNRSRAVNDLFRNVYVHIGDHVHVLEGLHKFFSPLYNPIMIMIMH